VKVQATPIGQARERGPAGVRAEIRPGAQRDLFRWRWRDEVATRDLQVDARVQAQSLIEYRRCRRGHARTLGRIEYLRNR